MKTQAELKQIYQNLWEQTAKNPAFESKIDPQRRALLIDQASLFPELVEQGWRVVEERVGPVVYRNLRHPEDPVPDHVTEISGVFTNRVDGRASKDLGEVI